MTTMKHGDPVVTHGDQARINQFARVHNRIEEIRADCAAKLTTVQNISEAADEMLLLDDACTIPMRVGESFVHMSAEEANAVMDDMKTKLENDIAELRVEEAKHAESLTKLKAELYAKFGDAINLDNSDAS